MAIFSSGGKEGGESPRRRASDLMPLSIVAHDLVVTGDFQADGVVKVEGTVKGTIRAGNQVLIAPGAVVQGDLHTREAVVGGTVHGTITATERVELQATAVVEGDIATPRIAILEGARVMGEVKMEGSAPEGA
ncbi:MAG: polymer-forming cytoskeletal protein [Gemmatimonadales bacterium]|jgi:cytoskeletal protein CcmA (bactofilin family)|nr:polymer-forming cytoskeletal protein [Gemmatimonadales bacterium]